VIRPFVAVLHLSFHNSPSRKLSIYFPKSVSRMKCRPPVDTASACRLKHVYVGSLRDRSCPIGEPRSRNDSPVHPPRPPRPPPPPPPPLRLKSAAHFVAIDGARKSHGHGAPLYSHTERHLVSCNASSQLRGSTLVLKRAAQFGTILLDLHRGLL